MYGLEKEKHLGGWLNTNNIWGDPGTWCPEIWDKIIRDFKIESVVDIGCGKGYSCKYFAKKGLNVTGIEGGINAINTGVFEGIILNNDYTKSSALEENNSYDLVWCCEFVEHVEECYSNYFLNDFNKCKYIAMTYAEPGQPGYHHVNCQFKEYWIEKIQEIGFKFNEEYSEILKQIATNANNSSFAHSGHAIKILFFEKLS